MSAILQQLGLDQTFFYQFGLFAVLFAIISRTYFRPFLQLIEARHKRTVEDREKAEALLQQAERTYQDYKTKLAEERAKVRAEVDAMMTEARAEEAKALGAAREEAKKITQAVTEDLAKQGAEIRRKLEGDVDAIAQAISTKLLGGGK